MVLTTLPLLAQVGPLVCSTHTETLSDVTAVDTDVPTDPVFYTALKQAFPEDEFINVKSINQLLLVDSACASDCGGLEADFRVPRFKANEDLYANKKETIGLSLQFLDRYKANFQEAKVSLPKELEYEERRLQWLTFDPGLYESARKDVMNKKIFLKRYRLDKESDIPLIEAKIRTDLEEVERQIQFIQNFKKRITNEVSSNRVLLNKFLLYYRLKSVSLMVRHRIGDSSCGLTDLEIFLLHEYSRYLFIPLNDALNLNKLEKIKQFQPIIEIINLGLSRLEPFSGNVIRGTKLPTNVDNEHIEGSNVLYPAFTSTSKSEEFGTESALRLHIKSRTGRYIAPLTERQHEQEVLLPSGAKFRITKRIGREIYMEETP